MRSSASKQRRGAGMIDIAADLEAFAMDRALIVERAHQACDAALEAIKDDLAEFGPVYSNRAMRKWLRIFAWGQALDDAVWRALHELPTVFSGFN